MDLSIFHHMAASPDAFGPLPVAADLPKALIASGEIWQRGRLWLSRPEVGLTAGVWESGCFRTHAFTFGADEFFTVLDGEIRLEEAGRALAIVRKGESALATRDSKIIWEQRVLVRKLFMRVDRVAR